MNTFLGRQACNAGENLFAKFIGCSFNPKGGKEVAKYPNTKLVMEGIQLAASEDILERVGGSSPHFCGVLHMGQEHGTQNFLSR